MAPEQNVAVWNLQGFGVWKPGLIMCMCITELMKRPTGTCTFHLPVLLEKSNILLFKSLLQIPQLHAGAGVSSSG